MSPFFFCALLFLVAGSEVTSAASRKPYCSELSQILACPMNMAPICGSDGQTYANECALCVQGLKTKTEILVVKDGSC